MDEHTYIRSIHRRLDRRIHRWKINARFADGVPDAWYSGPEGDLWVEYKYLKTPPKRYFTPAKLLSALQRAWLNDRLREGRSVSVIVGSPDGGLILTDGRWNDRITAPFSWLPTPEIAEWITAQTLSTSTYADAMPA